MFRFLIRIRLTTMASVPSFARRNYEDWPYRAAMPKEYAGNGKLAATRAVIV